VPTITITIEVPEGVTVAVGGQRNLAAAIAAAPPLVAVNACPEHNLPWKHVPAGVSKKTGKPYSAFWACAEMGCNRRPPMGWKPPVAAAVETPGDDFDWTDLEA
jgi:hypothetical protein